MRKTARNRGLTKYNPSKQLEGKDFLREKVRIRDNHTCQKCGLVWKYGMRRFDTHHLDKKFEGVAGNKYKNNSIDKMITLCHRCHMRIYRDIDKEAVDIP